MELWGLDYNKEKVKALPCINIQWNRRYYEAGDYQIQLRACDWDTSIRYIYSPDRPETGMVEKVEIERTVKGDLALISGFFLEGMLNWKTIGPNYSTDGELVQRTGAGLIAYMDDISLTLLPTLVTLTPYTVDADGALLGDAMYDMLKKQEASARIRLDYLTGDLTFQYWQGLDRTQSQSVNEYAAFSQSFGNVEDITLTTDSSNLRNYVVARYETNTAGVVPLKYFDFRETPTRPDGGPKRVLFVDTGLSDEEEFDTGDLDDAIKAAVLTAFADYDKVTNIDAEAIQRNLLYLTHYDLGDKCDIRDDRLGLAFEARIAEINEVWKNGQHTVSLQFGDKIPTKYRKWR
jgi:hypothetical protein